MNPAWGVPRAQSIGVLGGVMSHFQAGGSGGEGPPFGQGKGLTWAPCQKKNILLPLFLIRVGYTNQCMHKISAYPHIRIHSLKNKLLSQKGFGDGQVGQRVAPNFLGGVDETSPRGSPSKGHDKLSTS